MQNIYNHNDIESLMVARTIEMGGIGFQIPKAKRNQIIRKIKQLYKDDYEFIEDGEYLWITGDLHNRFRRKKIIFIMSGGKHGEDI